MGKELDWVRQEKSGRLIYRRRFPDDVRPFLTPPGKRELKVPLGARWTMTAEAFRKYEGARRQFDREVSDAKGLLILTL